MRGLEQFLRSCLGFASGEFVEVALLVGRSMRARCVPLDRVDDHAIDFLMSMGCPKGNFYVGSNPVRYRLGGRQSMKDSGGVRAMLLDFDPPGNEPIPETEGAARCVRDHILEATGYAPALLFSGRGHQLHVVHEFDTEPDGETALLRKTVCKGIMRWVTQQEAWRPVKRDVLVDATRLLRVPGSLNTKTGLKTRLLEPPIGDPPDNLLVVLKHVWPLPVPPAQKPKNKREVSGDVADWGRYICREGDMGCGRHPTIASRATWGVKLGYADSELAPVLEDLCCVMGIDQEAGRDVKSEVASALKWARSKVKESA